MPFAQADGARLYYEEAGAGEAVVFVHEFAGDCRSWEPQIRHFSRRYRCVAFNARGYPPSEVPDDQALYSQDIAADDIAAVMRGAGVDRAHVVGMSMGGFAALHFALRYADMARSIVVGACGYGAKPEESAQYALDSEAIAVEYETRGAAGVAEIYANGAYRLQLKEKDPRGWAEFRDQLAEHSTPKARRAPCGGCRSTAPRCGAWTVSRKCRCRRWWSPATRTTGAWSPGSTSSAPFPPRRC